MSEFISKILSFFLEKPLKIGIVSYYYPLDGPTTNGTAMHTYNLSKNLAELGCEVHVFTSNSKNKKISKKIGKGKLIIHSINVNFKFDVKDAVVSKRLRYSLFESRILSWLTYENSKRKFDIIHTQGWLTSSSFMLKHLNKLNWVHTFHALEQKRLKSMTKDEKRLFKITRWIEETIVDADRLITVSENSRKDVLRAFRGIAKKTVVIPNGVDLETFHPEKKSPLTVLYIGRFSKEKGIELVPEIAENILKEDKRYKFTVVAGETDNEELKPVQEKFIELAKTYKKRFNWITKPLNKSEISELYNLAGVYIQPSFYENAPLCVLEALGAGKAIVASRVGGIAEILGRAGFLAKPDAKEISTKVLRLLKDGKLRRKYSKLAAERAKQFDWKKIAEKTLKLYEEVIEESIGNKA